MPKADPPPQPVTPLHAASPRSANLDLLIGLSVVVGVFVIARLLLPHEATGESATDQPFDVTLHARVMLASDVFISLLAGWAAVCLRRLIAAFRSPRTCDPTSIARRPRHFAVFFFPMLGVLLGWWLGEWPGHMMSDEAYMLQRVTAGETFPWLSTSFSVYAISILRTLHNFTAVSLINCVILAAVIADALSLLIHAGLRRWIATVFFLLAITSVPLGMLATSLSHDILSASVKLCLVATVIRVVVRPRLTPRTPLPAFMIFNVFILTMIAATLRGENLALLLAIPLTLLLTGSLRPVRAATMCAGLIVLVVLWNGPVTRAISPDEPHRKSRYSLTLLINPLGFYLANGYGTPSPEQDLATLARVVDLNDLRALYSPYNIDTYWRGASKGHVTPEEMVDVKRLFVRATLDNPGLFLASRTATFSGMLGMSPHTNFWFYEGRERKPLDGYPNSNPPLRQAFDAELI